MGGLISTIYMFYDVFPWKDVPSECPKPLVWVCDQVFSSQTHKILKLAYHRNYCIVSNQILCSDKEHKVLFAGGPNMHQMTLR